MVWWLRANAECLSRAHLLRMGVSKQIREAKPEQFTRVFINVKDNAQVNFKVSREVVRTQLPRFLVMEIGCKIHRTAMCMTRLQYGLLEWYISGQLQWSLYLNRGQTLVLYPEMRLRYGIVMDVYTGGQSI